MHQITESKISYINISMELRTSTSISSEAITDKQTDKMININADFVQKIFAKKVNNLEQEPIDCHLELQSTFANKRSKALILIDIKIKYTELNCTRALLNSMNIILGIFS